MLKKPLIRLQIAIVFLSTHGSSYALMSDIGSFRGHPESGHTPEPSDHEMQAVSGSKAVVTTSVYATRRLST